MPPFILTRPLLFRQACSRTAFAAAPRPLLASLPMRCFTHSAFRRQADQHSSFHDSRPSSSSSTQPTSSHHDDNSDDDNREPTENEITASAYDFPWLSGNDTYSTRIPHYPYPGAPVVWSMLRFLPQSVQYFICKAACERMLRNNTSSEYYPDQFLQGTSLAMYQLLPLLATNVDRTPLQSMLTQELYDVFEHELAKQERLGSDVSIRLAAVHDGLVKDVWVQLGPKVASGTTRGFVRWRWQTLTVSMRGARGGGGGGIDEISSRDHVTQMMMEGVQFQVDVELDVSIEYRIHNRKLGLDLVSDFTRRPLLVRFQTPYFQPAEEMVRSRKMSRPDEAPIDWCWRVADIDYWLEQDFVERRKKDDALEEEHAKREMGLD